MILNTRNPRQYLAALILGFASFGAQASVIALMQTDLSISSDAYRYYGWTSATRFSVQDYDGLWTHTYPPLVNFENTSGVLGINGEPNATVNYSSATNSVLGQFSATGPDATNNNYVISADNTVTATTGPSDLSASTWSQQALVLYFDVQDTLQFGFDISIHLQNASLQETGYSKLARTDLGSINLYANYYDQNGGYIGGAYIFDGVGPMYSLWEGEEASFPLVDAQEFLLNPNSEWEGAAGATYVLSYNVSTRVYEYNDAPQPPGSVPEPGTIGLLGAGLFALFLKRRKLSKPQNPQ